ncbi:hypothetical protein [Blastococcus sp. TF02A-26]|uniref:hypothetical protein n=1 Tax=Blastococcus sp. TF02A-26 TaxID=2250577 RepID=UPI000DE81C30|nr:hypothetical protein [Blastococcus sp. TF02A-26]RBY88561.1 hypothetical protein DQ240_03855 [Blastococcus sp. TF02A-26]
MIAGAYEGNLVRRRVAASGASIYDDPELVGSPLYYTAEDLEAVLREHLVGVSDLGGLPVRTRSKVAKTLVCYALGYAPPASFTKTQPRLRHPNLDVYVQESSNLQVWNQEVDAARRYVIIILRRGLVADVRVIAGADLAQYDTTGTLTRKYQASRIVDSDGAVLVSERDTDGLIAAYDPGPWVPLATSPVELPDRGRVLEIAGVFAFLAPMVGQIYDDPGVTQERNRGSVVHREACERLGLSHFADHGQFPDVLSQLVEVKLQLARTIDLGLELPNSDAPLASVNGTVAVSDCRYAIFYGDREGSTFTITALVVVTGEDFFTEFRQFGGRVSNSKLQLRLPSAWFS